MTGGAPRGRPTVRPLDERDLPAVAELWNATFAGWHPLGLRGLERWWRSPDTISELTFAVVEGGALRGVLLARAPARGWTRPEQGFVSLLAVAPEAQGRGLGSALWEAAVAALEGRGRRTLRLGGDPDHLLPGVPAVAPAAAWRFLQARGARFEGLEADFLVDLRSCAAPGPSALRLVDDAPEEVAAFVERCFPGRWADEVARCAELGVSVLGARPRGAANEGALALVGFAVAYRFEDALLGPSLVWSAALPGRPGGLGPLGIDPAYRGRGLGLALVAEAVAWHRERGTQDLIIDWTTLADFYGRAGARVWRVYQRASVTN